MADHQERQHYLNPEQADEAVKFWRDHNLTISDAIQCMTGWTEGAAISVFGRRYIQPKRKHFI